MTNDLTEKVMSRLPHFTVTKFKIHLKTCWDLHQIGLFVTGYKPPSLNNFNYGRPTNLPGAQITPLSFRALHKLLDATVTRLQ